MSIASELTRIQTAKADIKTAIEAKGVTVPSSATIDTYDDYITSIPSGGGGSSADTEALKGMIQRNITSLVIPSGVTSIGNYAFFQCSSLSSVTIPNSVTSIGEGAFDSCGFTSIGGTGSGASVEIPNSVTYLGNGSFGSCGALSEVTIPSTITTIDSNVFSYCGSLASITCLAATPPTLGEGAFDETNDCPIYVPGASLSTYKSASGWSTYESRIQSEQPPQWVDYASGEIIPTDLDIYGVSGTSASLCNTFPYVDNTIYFYLERNAVIADIGPGCYSGSYPMSGNIEITFSDVVDAGCSDSYRLDNAVNVITGVKLLIYQ